MKKYFIRFILFVCLNLFVFCNGQNKKSVIKDDNKTMDKFDISKYEERLKHDPFYEGYDTKEAHIKQYHIIKDGYVEERYDKNIVTFFVEEIITKNAYKTVKKYYKDGSIESIKYFFNDDLEIGNWEYFKDNKIYKSDDKDKDFKISLQDILAFGNKRKVDFTKNGKITRKFYDNLDGYIWILEWNTGVQGNNEEEYIFKRVIINDSNQKIIKEEEYSLNPFIRY